MIRCEHIVNQDKCSNQFFWNDYCGKINASRMKQVIEILIAYPRRSFCGDEAKVFMV